MNETGPLPLVIQVASVLDELGIPYALGGSMASAFFGEPRATADIDVAISVDVDAGDRLVDRMRAEVYVPVASAREAVAVPGYEPGVWVTSPEDQILRKLDWYRRGGSISDRQWRDLLGLLAVGAGTLDLHYLRETASEVDLSSLLVQAVGDTPGFT